MRPIAWVVLLLGWAWPASSAAQELEAYQSAVLAVGWGAIGSNDVENGDADGSFQLAAGLDIRQRPNTIAFVRVDFDNPEVRQHYGLTGGWRFRRPGERFTPYAGVGAGLLWIEPKGRYGDFFQREFGPRADGIAGVEVSPHPALRWFAEYRLTGARFKKLQTRQNCSPDLAIDRCVEVGSDPEIQLGHTLWAGMRVKMF